MSIVNFKKKLFLSEFAFFETNKSIICWRNKYFDLLFDFLDKNELNKKLSLKNVKKKHVLSLQINKENIYFDVQLLTKNNKNNLFKINDEQIKYILALKDGLECYKEGKIKFAVQKQYKLNNCNGNLDTTLQHLPPCQMIRYDPVPLPPPLDLPKCVPPAHKMQFA